MQKCRKSALTFGLSPIYTFPYWILPSTVFNSLLKTQNKSKMKLEKIVAQKCSVKMVYLKNSLQFRGKHLCWGLIFMKLQPATLLKWDSSAVAFLQILHNFQKHLFQRTLANGSFRNNVQESMQIMRGLHKLILSANKMAAMAKSDVHWWKEVAFFFLIFVLRERNQTRSELSGEIL